jgi:predicted ferric reductase
VGRLDFKKILKEFGKIISFNSEYRPYVFIIVLSLLMIIPLSVLEITPKFSICQRILGDSCPSAGITRGVSCLLKGNFELAMQYNKISILVLIVMIVIILNDFYNKFNTKRIK